MVEPYLEKYDLTTEVTATQKKDQVSGGGSGSRTSVENPAISEVKENILKMVDNKIYVSCKIFESFMSTLGVYNDSDKVYY